LDLKNSRKNLFTSAWLLGRKVAEFLIIQKFAKYPKTNLIIHTTSTTNYKLKFFLKGLRDHKLQFDHIKLVNKISYNGTKKKALRRTGRRKKIFF